MYNKQNIKLINMAIEIRKPNVIAFGQLTVSQK